MSKARDLGDAANKANFLDNVTSDIQAQLTSLIFPAGTIITFGSSSAPSGYLPCEGQVLVRADYLALFTAIGVTWNTGGETGAQFRVPDLRGAFLRGAGSNATHNMANGSDFAGPSVGSFEDDQMQGHKHTFGTTGDIGQSGSNRNAPHTPNTDLTYLGIVGNPSTDGTNGTPRTGDETRPFNAGILYCIKT